MAAWYNGGVTERKPTRPLLRPHARGYMKTIIITLLGAALAVVVGSTAAPTQQVPTVKAAQLAAVKEIEAPDVEVIKEAVPQPVVDINTCDYVRSIASKYTDWSPEIIARIANAESHCMWWKVGDTTLTFTDGDGVVRGMSCGALQIRVLVGRPDCESLKNPDVAIDWAHKIWQGQGYSAWSVCSNGRASCY